MAQLRLFRFCVRAFPRQTARRRERSARMDVLNFLVPLTAPKLNYLVANNTKRQEGKKQKRKTKQKKTQPRDRRKDVAQKSLSEGAQFLPGNPRGFCIDTIKLVNRSLSLSSCPQKKFLFKQRDLFLLCERTKNLKKEKYSKKRVAYWVLASGRQRPNMSSLFHG